MIKSLHFLEGRIFMKNAAKFVAFAAAAVTGAALVGVGFASWVIGGQTVASAGGNIQVDTVVDGINLEVSVAEDSAVVYGGPQQPKAAEYSWLENDSTAEQLKVNLTISYTGKVDNVTIDLAVLRDSVDITSSYNSCITQGIISDYSVKFMANGDFNSSYVDDSEQPLTAEYVSAGKYTITNLPESETTVTLYVQLRFGWGTLFGCTNPVDFFNDFAPDDMLKQNGGILEKTQEPGNKTAREWADELLTELGNSLTNYNNGVSTTFHLTLTAE